VAVGEGKSAESAARDGLAKLAAQTAESTESAAIADTFFDGESETHLALAVMDLAPLRAQLAAELALADAKLGAAVASADVDSPDQALPKLEAALALQSEREALRARLVKLGGEVPEAASALPGRADLERRLAETRKLLPIEVEAWEMDPSTGETLAPLDELRREIVKKVIAAGFPVSPQELRWGGDPVWLSVRARLALERLHLGDAQSVVAVQWDAVVEISDPAAGAELTAMLTQEGRATHLNETEARRQARGAAAEFVAESLETWLESRARTPQPDAAQRVGAP
jgi:hypothetical protein